MHRYILAFVFLVVTAAFASASERVLTVRCHPDIAATSTVVVQTRQDIGGELRVVKRFVSRCNEEHSLTFQPGDFIFLRMRVHHHTPQRITCFTYLADWSGDYSCGIAHMDMHATVKPGR